MVNKIIADKNNISRSKIEKLYKSTEDVRLKERYLAIAWSLENEFSATQIAKLLFLNERTVMRWIKSFNKYGLEGLEMKKSGGRPGKLSSYSKKLIISWIERKEPSDFGILDQVWTCPVISLVLDEELGIIIHPQNIRLFLKKNGYSFKMPERVHPNADESKKSSSKAGLRIWRKE